MIAFDKPLTWTSFNLVKVVRNNLSRRLGVKRLKVGHAGTLDPLATGVMILCTGSKTKLIDRLQAGTKEYVATLRLGCTTPSFDAEHPVDATFPTAHITREAVDEALLKFKGSIWQVPPTYSACKVDGRRAFDYMRQGEEVELKAKELVIDEIERIDLNLPEQGILSPKAKEVMLPAEVDIKAWQEAPQYQGDCSAVPYLTIRVVCSKGTYIRALARDIGLALGSGAYLIGLRRTRVGDISVGDCLQLDDVERWAAEVPIVLSPSADAGAPAAQTDVHSAKTIHSSVNTDDSSANADSLPQQ